jgi:uncharacterized membrane protein
MVQIKTISTWLYAAIMFGAGICHFIKPGMYAPFIPQWLPLLFVNYSIGTIEVGIGIGLIVPRWKPQASLWLLILMIAFLPLHIIDVFRLHPAIGSPLIAWIRLPLQFFLIYWAWVLVANPRLNKLLFY